MILYFPNSLHEFDWQYSILSLYILIEMLTIPIDCSSANLHIIVEAVSSLLAVEIVPRWCGDEVVTFTWMILQWVWHWGEGTETYREYAETMFSVRMNFLCFSIEVLLFRAWVGAIGNYPWFWVCNCAAIILLFVNIVNNVLLHWLKLMRILIEVLFVS